MKMLKSFLFVVVLIIVAAIAFSSCKNGGKLTSIIVTPGDITVIPGTSLQYQAQGHLSDNATYFLSSAIWSSSTPSVAHIDPTSGFVVSADTGTTLITVSDPYSNFTGTTLLTVDLLSSVTVTPTLPSMTPGLTHQFTATGILAHGATQDLTSRVTWTTSPDITIATVVSTPGVAGTGVVTSLATGTALIQAAIVTIATDMTSTTTIVGSTMLTVTSLPLSSLAIDPSAAIISLPTGTQQFTVTGKLTDGTTPWQGSAVWSSSNTAVATVDINSGLATAGTTTGVTTITATDPITSLASSATLTVQ